MSKKIENLDRRPVILSLNSGRTLFIDPGTFPGEIGDAEVRNNTMVNKLRERGIIAVHSYPAVKGGPRQRPSAPGPEKRDQKPGKSRIKGGK